MRCVSSVEGEKAGHLIPQRGLRQGDPLSSYLFLICVERLSRLLKHAAEVKLVSGLSIARRSPSITHLFFADDSLLFFKATEREGRTIKSCLKNYKVVSGQVVNYDKSVLTVSPNASNEIKSHLGSLLDVHVVECHHQYLGLPSFARYAGVPLSITLKIACGRTFKGGKANSSDL